MKFSVLFILLLSSLSTASTRTQVFDCFAAASESTTDDLPVTDSCDFQIPSDGLYEIKADLVGRGNLNIKAGSGFEIYNADSLFHTRSMYLESGTQISLYASGFHDSGDTGGNLDIYSLDESRPNIQGYGDDSFSNSKSTNGYHGTCYPSPEPQNIQISYTAPEDGVYQISMSGSSDGPNSDYDGYVNGSTVITGDPVNDQVETNSGSYKNNVSLNAGDQVTISGYASTQFTGWGDNPCTADTSSSVDISLEAQQLQVQQLVQQIPNSAAPAGSLWIQSDTLRWTDGTTEYYTKGTSKVTSSSPGPTGAVWIEGSSLHWIDQNDDERKFKGKLITSGVNAAQGSIWMESGSIHYIDANSDERAIK